MLDPNTHEANSPCRSKVIKREKIVQKDIRNRKEKDSHRQGMAGTGEGKCVNDRACRTISERDFEWVIQKPFELTGPGINSMSL